MTHSIQYLKNLPAIRVTIQTPDMDRDALSTYLSDITDTLSECTQSIFVQIDARNQKFDNLQTFLKFIQCHNDTSILDHDMTAAMLVVVDDPRLKAAIDNLTAESTFSSKIRAFYAPGAALAYIKNALQQV